MEKILSFLALVAIIIIFFTAPVSAAGIAITDGGKITTPDGGTSPVITITDSEITMGSTILIDISGLHEFVAAGTLTNDNVVVFDTAALWSGEVAGDILTLTSTNGPAAVDESIVVTFTGAVNPWVF